MKLARDTWLVFERYLWLVLRNPVWVIVGIIQPLLYLALFAPLLSSVATLPGFPPGGAYNVFVPGLLIQLGLFGAAFVGFSLIAEIREGVVERLRVTPVSRVALLLGRAFRDVLILLVQSLLLIGVAVPFGLRLQFSGLIVVLGLLALIGLLAASCSYALALWLRSEDALAPFLSTITLPLLLLSGVLLPLSLAPGWIRAIAAINPLAYAVDAARAIVNNQLGDPSVLRGIVIVGVLAIVAVVATARAFGRAAA
jgi:ABC-2 type transport system permease protein